ncbi:hypothetical protein TPL01_27830 [Sulfuriferula plumbiphila]|uniref:Uncharacterized protein n=1 Tax=Sulfuriferula plumbiphila TaxID=171865 RepID=A0A512LAY2_9PROT|nr:hypothetical protein [Sulfuriferula plumbiphila]BBP03933.1 hypothetical protein SFPGR_13550 [Sulfuriferula plumbiphila]GEP31645.1 hypothetical protein TPL01_27830 [Sulfuriferula plumbiphila]
MTHSRILIMLTGLMLAAAAHAELPPSLGQATVQLALTPAQRQSLTTNLESALAAGVEEQDLRAVMRLAAMHKYSAVQAAAFVQKLAAVRRDGLPVALVRDKLLEGMAKKVPSETILAVASKWQEALQDARSRVQAMEERGLKYGNTEERDTLINLGAGLRQRYGAKEALSTLAQSGTQGGRMASSAGSLIAAGNLAELLLLHDATPTQALELPRASLRAGDTPAQILTLQKNVLDQLRQGIAPVDVVARMRRQFSPEADGRPPFATPGQTPGGSWPGGGFPGGGFPGGGFPGGAPGGGFPGGGFPGGGFPGGGFPGGVPGGGFPKGGGGY